MHGRVTQNTSLMLGVDECAFIYGSVYNVQCEGVHVGRNLDTVRDTHGAPLFHVNECGWCSDGCMGSCMLHLRAGACALHALKQVG